MRAGRVVLGLLLATSLLLTGCWGLVSEEDQRACQAILDIRMVARTDRATANRVKAAVNDWIRSCSNGKMSSERPYRSFRLLNSLLADQSRPLRQIRISRLTLYRARVVQRQFWDVRKMLKSAAANGTLGREEYAYLHSWLKERRTGVTVTANLALAVLKWRGVES